MRMQRYLLLLALAFQFSLAFGQPTNIHLSWNESKKHTTSTTMAFTWTSDHSGKAMVKYGTSAQLSRSSPAEVKYSEAAKTYVYKASLKGLRPATIYYYACGSNQEGWSQTYSFKTGPAAGSPDKFVVGVWTDTQDNKGNTRFEKTDAIVRQLRKHPIQLTIHMGDIVNVGSNVASWKNFFRTSQPLNAIAPFMPVTGNHDVDNKAENPGFQKPFPVFHDLFQLPGQNFDYSFNYGNTHFVSINSGFAAGAEKAGKVLYAPGSAEYRWLEQDLARARKNKKITWVIVYMHYPLYSYGWSHINGWQQHITPLLDQYQVDLCLAGHRHVYERHKAIRNNQVIPQQDRHGYKSPAGTVYITNGTSGGMPTEIGGSDLPTMVFTSPVQMYNYALMTIQDKHIHYEVYNEKDEKIDYFILSK